MSRGEQFPLNNTSYRPQQAISYARGGQAKTVSWNTGAPPRMWGVNIGMETETKKDALIAFFQDDIDFVQNTFYFVEEGDIVLESGTDGEIDNVVGGDTFQSASAQFQTVGVAVGDILHVTSGTNAGYYGVEAVDSETRLNIDTNLADATGMSYDVYRWRDKQEVRLTSPDVDWQETMLTGQGSPVYDITLEMRSEV